MFGGALAPYVAAALNIQHMILNFAIFANQFTLISSLTKIFHFFQIYGKRFNWNFVDSRFNDFNREVYCKWIKDTMSLLEMTFVL
jgi:hypothetical protein